MISPFTIYYFFPLTIQKSPFTIYYFLPFTIKHFFSVA